MSDLINRQDAIDAIEKAKTAITEDGEIYVAKINAEMNIDLLPSAERRGKWIRTVLGATSGYGTTVMYQCSKCGKMAMSEYHYCPNCGANI